jgi:hypothetical protein
MSPEFERLVGRAVMDTEFRDNLLKDPEGAAKAAGFNLTDDELAELKSAIDRYNDQGSASELGILDGKVGLW